MKSLRMGRPNGLAVGKKDAENVRGGELEVFATRLLKLTMALSSRTRTLLRKSSEDLEYV
eukprot:CAMPEP_0172495294 /NCGR_PEP_ID=MMETSP1066-20121228/67061_1 /TAXON_ID=671091 /ORGANISM="Coscinodiscus wailesii, Strain CCMP2513" /LENGTH=59 /DNA_ID=CAMNT_0013266869 /DNA_START=49 /DNA_END=228 /DNA_ORIENTATION=-